MGIGGHSHNRPSGELYTMDYQSFDTCKAGQTILVFKMAELALQPIISLLCQWKLGLSTTKFIVFYFITFGQNLRMQNLSNMFKIILDMVLIKSIIVNDMSV